MNNLLKTLIAVAAMSITSVFIAGCGSSSSSGDDSEPVVSRGIITGFGSVYVNGRRYKTDDARFEVDDESGNEDDLRIGMVVTVLGTRDKNGYEADDLIYDNELKGPVSSIAIDPGDATRKTLTILGQAVLVTGNTTIDDDGNLSFDTIAIGDVLEVSGYAGISQFIATHIELQDNDDEIEIKGMIENLNADSFKIRGFPISYNELTEIDDDISALADGLFVEVEGRLNGGGDTLIADEIESEYDDYMDDVDDIEIRGVISDYSSTNMTFMLRDQLVDASRAELEPASLMLTNGLIVEVEGYIADGVLFADEIELEDDDDDYDDDDDDDDS